MFARYLSNRHKKLTTSPIATLIPNDSDNAKFFSVIYDSDYSARRYADIQNYSIDERADDAIRISSSTALRGSLEKWRIRFVPGGIAIGSHELGITIIVENPSGRIRMCWKRNTRVRETS